MKTKKINISEMSIEEINERISLAHQYEHRLKMVADDLAVVKEFIHKNNLDETFQNIPTKYADNCWIHLNNIMIACDLTEAESLTWRLFNT